MYMYTHYHCLLLQVPTPLSNVPRAHSPTQLGSQIQDSAQTVQLGITASRLAWLQRKGTVPRAITAPRAPLTVWPLSVPLAWCAQRAVTSPGHVPLDISPTRLDSGNATSVPMGKMKIAYFRFDYVNKQIKGMRKRWHFKIILYCCPRFYCLPENVTAGIPTSGHFDCPAGYYCPSGTGLDWKPCPKGTYSQQTNLFQVNQDFLVVWNRVSDTHYTDGIRTKLIINTLYI